VPALDVQRHRRLRCGVCHDSRRRFASDSGCLRTDIHHQLTNPLLLPDLFTAPGTHLLLSSWPSRLPPTAMTKTHVKLVTSAQGRDVYTIILVILISPTLRSPFLPFHANSDDFPLGLQIPVVTRAHFSRTPWPLRYPSTPAQPLTECDPPHPRPLSR
jgi:hypothetical protein